MKISQSLMEPWFLKYQDVPYNLAESGVDNQTLEQLIDSTNIKIADLLQISLANNDTHGSLNLRKTIASFYEGIDADRILVTHGTTEAIFMYFHIRYKPKANVVVFSPAFEVLYQIPQYLNYEVRLLPLKKENDFRPDLEQLSNLIDDNTEVIVLNTPHNPTGIMFSGTEIETIIKLAEKHNCEILADEHYRFINYDNTDILPSLINKSSKIVSLGSPGKCFGCIGLRIGWIIGSHELISACRDFKDYTTHTVCSVNDFLILSVLQNWQKIIPKYKQRIQDNLHQLRTFINQHQDLINWIEPQAGIVAFPFFVKPINSQEFAQKLVEKTGVLILPGEAFNMPGHLRICLGVQQHIFAKALSHFSEFILSKHWL
ncbi:aminotransferase [Dulcicalothrix desertica PCC 7102]|uniref:Aminotransferase n=1 Tax=Dulcicalothrix desertica PCC 7102 TaxID=232991 RepID=A0A3S1C409_9CYAN|nr:aminotransferase class I/II-fold pyridoxal phosphate-dependent enzyme [Dulcicalothrix desertica]RUS96563.1 aminotransferase [Dulcicalothrix desertica PCC 7102]TWH51403.1 aspartate/methionine/tyrosine aminotransferase [Dulcicalothrix desertica PCC 7102]